MANVITSQGSEARLLQEGVKHIAGIEFNEYKKECEAIFTRSTLGGRRSVQCRTQPYSDTKKWNIWRSVGKPRNPTCNKLPNLDENETHKQFQCV